MTGVEWAFDTISSVFYGATLFIEGVVFEVVTFLYRLFNMMCTLNFNSIYALVAPLIDRLQAVIMVVVVYKVGVSLVSFLFDPEKAASEGSKIVINIFITAALLLSYNFFFSIMNEFNILIMGNSMHYEYTYLNQLVELSGDPDEGLIVRMIYGERDIGDVGTYIAKNTLKVFLHNYGDPGDMSNVEYYTDTGTSTDFKKIRYLSSKANPRNAEMANSITRPVEYIPILPFVLGLYLCYSLVKMSIEIGVRMFQLLILQMLAPVAIITIIDQGTKGTIFQNYIKKYIEIFTGAFIRMFSVLFVCSFICEFFEASFSYLPEVFQGGIVKTITIERLLITVLVVVAAFKFIGDIPGIIDSLFGTHLASGDKKGGFGHFLGGLIGGTLGAVGGFAAGFASGGRGLNPFSRLASGVSNMVAGGYNGAAGGSKANKVSEFFKNNAEVGKANIKRGRQYGSYKGGAIGMGLSHLPRPIRGYNDRRNQRLLTESQNRSQALEDMMTARREALANLTDGNVKFGNSADEYASRVAENDANVQRAKANYEAATTAADKEHWAKEYNKALNKARGDAKKEYEWQLFHNQAVNADEAVRNTTSRAPRGIDERNVDRMRNEYSQEQRNINSRGTFHRPKHEENK